MTEGAARRASEKRVASACSADGAAMSATSPESSHAKHGNASSACNTAALAASWPARGAPQSTRCGRCATPLPPNAWSRRSWSPPSSAPSADAAAATTSATSVAVEHVVLDALEHRELAAKNLGLGRGRPCLELAAQPRGLGLRAAELLAAELLARRVARLVALGARGRRNALARGRVVARAHEASRSSAASASSFSSCSLAAPPASSPASLAPSPPSGRAASAPPPPRSAHSASSSRSSACAGRLVAVGRLEQNVALGVPARRALVAVPRRVEELRLRALGLGARLAERVVRAAQPPLERVALDLELGRARRGRALEVALLLGDRLLEPRLELLVRLGEPLLQVADRDVLVLERRELGVVRRDVVAQLLRLERRGRVPRAARERVAQRGRGVGRLVQRLVQPEEGRVGEARAARERVDLALVVACARAEK